MRGFVGDVLVVMFIYSSVRTVMRVKPVPLGAAVFALALRVELFQWISPGSKNQSLVAEATIGSTFDPLDVVAYAIGVVAIVVLDLKRKKD